MIKKILVLTEKITGGEWIATNRLIQAVGEHYSDYKFYKIAFGKNIMHSNQNGFMGFFRASISDFRNSRKEINKFLNKNHEIDYIISTNYLLSLVCLTIKDLVKTRRIFYLHGTKSIPIYSLFQFNYRQIVLKILELLALLSSNIIIVVCKYKGLLQYFKTIVILPNYVPNVFFNKDGNIKKSNFILYSGRLVTRKGLENLIEGFNLFSQNYKNINLVICYPESSADIELKYFLEKKIKKYKLSERVRFKKNLKLLERIYLYRKALLTILPSEIEMGPLSIIESLASKTIAIGTRVGNIAEMLGRVDTSLLLDSNDSIAINDKLVWFFKLSSKKTEYLINKGYNLMKFYTSKKFARKFVDILESVAV